MFRTINLKFRVKICLLGKELPPPQLNLTYKTYAKFQTNNINFETAIVTHTDRQEYRQQKLFEPSVEPYVHFRNNFFLWSINGQFQQCTPIF